MSGYTKGPLQIVEGYEVWDTRGDGEPGIPLAKADLGLNRRWGRDISGSEIMANLALFAAAPDLLEALKALLGEVIEWSPEKESKVIAARAAIAKAGGQS